MKRLLCVLSVLIVMVGIVACGNQSTTDKDTTAPTESEMTANDLAEQLFAHDSEMNISPWYREWDVEGNTGEKGWEEFSFIADQDNPLKGTCKSFWEEGDMTPQEVYGDYEIMSGDTIRYRLKEVEDESWKTVKVKITDDTLIMGENKYSYKAPTKEDLAETLLTRNQTGEGEGMAISYTGAWQHDNDRYGFIALGEANGEGQSGLLKGSCPMVRDSKQQWGEYEITGKDEITISIYADESDVIDRTETIKVRMVGKDAVQFNGEVYKRIAFDPNTGF